MFRTGSIARLFAAACVSGILLCSSAHAATAKPEDVKKMEAALPDKAPAMPKKARKILVYGNANGFVHSSIPLGMETIAKLGEKTGAWTATLSMDPAVFDDLSGFDGVVLVSTTGHFLLPHGELNAPKEPKDASAADKEKFEAKKKEYEEKKPAEEARLAPYKDKEPQRMQNLVDFVEKNGKGVVGIHAATDAYYDNRPYGVLMGGYFNGHPWNTKVGIKIDDPKSPLTSMFDAPAGFDVADEIYQFTPKGKAKSGEAIQTFSRENDHVLLSLDTKTPDRTPARGNSASGDYGVAWIKADGMGRVFYCSLGHREEIYWNPTILKFYLAGIQYALGDLEADATPK